MKPNDVHLAKRKDISMLYGELTAAGLNRAMNNTHLMGDSAEVIFDFGMGVGKVIVQSFLQYRNVKYALGVELSTGRFERAVEAVKKIVELHPK